MEKIETIIRHKTGIPKKELSCITWVEFIAYIKPQSEDEMHKYAISLLNGDFLYSRDGYTYYLMGMNLR